MISRFTFASALSALMLAVLALAWDFAPAARAQTPEAPLTAVSQPQGLRVHMHSELLPLVINQMHSWIISLEDVEGNPVEDARISVSGGMPAHDHGLATSPQVTAYLGEGRYQLDGMRFHMNGAWQLQLRIEHAGTRYQANFELNL